MTQDTGPVSLSAARFLCSAGSLRSLPPDTGYEVAFAGRSNAGKSSIINALCRQRGLARTSRTPGRTQTINFFTVRPEARLVDLPGLGYADAPVAIKSGWERLVASYLERRHSLRGLMYLTDVRHPLQANDLKALRFISACELPLLIALSKADKLGRAGQQDALRKTKAILQSLGNQAPTVLVSASAGLGLSELTLQIDNWLTGNEPPRPESESGATHRAEQCTAR